MSEWIRVASARGIRPGMKIKVDPVPGNSCFIKEGPYQVVRYERKLVVLCEHVTNASEGHYLAPLIKKCRVSVRPQTKFEKSLALYLARELNV